MLRLRALFPWQADHTTLTVARLPWRTARASYGRRDLQQPFRKALRPVSIGSASVSPRPPASLTIRVIRSIFYTAFFGASGFVIGWGAKTWIYLRSGTASASPARRNKTRERFAKAVERSSLVQSLKKDGWIEEDPTKQEHLVDRLAPPATETTRGLHMVNDQLDRGGHIITRHFRHPTDAMTVLVFMADPACESWPGVLHGGIATAVIQDTLDTHVKNHPQYAPVGRRETAMNYRLPLNPDVLYSVLVRTDNVNHPFRTPTGDDDSFAGIVVEVLVNQMDRAPRYILKGTEGSEAQKRVCDIHTTNPANSAYVKGSSVLFMAKKEIYESVQQRSSGIRLFEQKRDQMIQMYEEEKALRKSK